MRGVEQRRIVARSTQRFYFGVARELAQLACADFFSKKKRRGVGKLVGFIENDGVACRQELIETFILKHDVGEEQMMIHDDDVRRKRFLAGIHHEAFAVVRASAAQAILARGSDV